MSRLHLPQAKHDGGSGFDVFEVFKPTNEDERLFELISDCIHLDTPVSRQTLAGAWFCSYIKPERASLVERFCDPHREKKHVR
jgi:hypothetical protein